MINMKKDQELYFVFGSGMVFKAFFLRDTC